MDSGDGIVKMPVIESVYLFIILGSSPTVSDMRFACVFSWNWECGEPTVVGILEIFIILPQMIANTRMYHSYQTVWEKYTQFVQINS